jgi:steroid 5-alpha reductase family enzyme|tara:strand:+ start:4241 stop:5080 length:840 start_codon:yes stop_codon:yes gene_type:complete
MKQNAVRIVLSILVFGISFFVATLTKLEIVENAILLAFLIHWLFFIPAFLLKTEKFFDLTGSLTYISIMVYVVYTKNNLQEQLGSIILASLVILWAVRLGSFLFLRIKKAGEDKRFREIKTSFARFFLLWTISGMWVSFCSMCALTAIASNDGVIVNNIFYIGLVTFIIGLSIEIIADSQKTKFRKDPNNKDKFINEGLWAKSRHPNYVGEITLWAGVAIMSFSSLEGSQYISLISPIFTYLLLVYVSGVPQLTASGQKKWGHLESYQDYIKNTPTLIF